MHQMNLGKLILKAESPGREAEMLFKTCDDTPLLSEVLLCKTTIVFRVTAM